MTDNNLGYLLAAHVLSALLLGGWIGKVLWQGRKLRQEEVTLRAQGAKLEDESGSDVVAS